MENKFDKTMDTMTDNHTVGSAMVSAVDSAVDSGSTRDRQFERMQDAAVKKLEGRDPLEVARLSGAKYKANVPALELRFLGREVQISTTDWRVRYVDVDKHHGGVDTYDVDNECGGMDGWAQLVILHYLAQADGFPVTWHEVTYGDLKDGLVRGTGFDRSSQKQLEAYLKNKNPEEVLQHFKKLGAVVIGDKIRESADGGDHSRESADGGDHSQGMSHDEPITELTAVFGFLPHYPLTVKVSFADEEFESTGRIFADKCADHYLSIEDHVTAGQILLDEICR